MDASHANTALLVFSRFLEKELKEKILHGDKDKNFEILRQFNKQLSKKVQQSRIPAFHFDDNRQYGDSFGEKLSNALKEVFDAGFQKVIVVGNDCPDLSVKDIHKASSQLSVNDIVLGPDLRGGAYLIGITRKAFNKTIFENLRWQTGFLVDSFQDYAAEYAYSLLLLGRKADFNISDDISAYWSVSSELRKIMNLIDQAQPSPRFPFIFSGYEILITASRRGPPLAA